MLMRLNDRWVNGVAVVDLVRLATGWIGVGWPDECAEPFGVKHERRTRVVAVGVRV